MSEQHSVPWPIWAIVSIAVALIGAWAIQRASHQDPLPHTPAVVTGVSERQPASPSNQARVVPPPNFIPANATSVVDVTPEAVRFTIHDTLGRAQLQERVRVLLDGTHIGTLEISTDNQSATLHATVPAPGRYSWSASAAAVFVDEKGNPFTYTGSGQGIIAIDENSSFDLRAVYSGSTWTLTLERDDISSE
ncbi:MAG TPA: hypothetical protein VGD79_04525 [Thermoanaerobaculia bacterium]